MQFALCNPLFILFFSWYHYYKKGEFALFKLICRDCLSTASTISMNELYTANIALSVFAMAIMLFSLRGDISQSKIRNLLCGGQIGRAHV